MSKFLTYEDRMEIEAGLREKNTFKGIAEIIGKDRTTVAKEIKRYSVEEQTGYGDFPYNICKYRKSCKRKTVCGSTATCASKEPCKKCFKLCNRYCEDFEEVVCKNRYRIPYACNGCGEVKRCTLTKTIYCAKKAHMKALEVMSEARSGIFSTEDEICRMNDILLPLIKQGHSIHQIYLNQKDELMCSERTLYNYVEAGLFDVKNIDLPRKVRYKPRYVKPELKVDTGCRVGRNYHDYEDYISQHSDTAVVQMDSVIGKRGGKVLLTIYFVSCSLMLAFLRERNTSKSVTDIFENMYCKLGLADFIKLFPIILTDNGSEFSNPRAIEFGSNKDETLAIQRTKIFYCNPSAPYQKAEIEVGHEFIRRIVPKGKGFDDYTQEDINKMMSHINSYKRDKLGGKSPYQAFNFYYGEEPLKKLGIDEIEPKKIILKPALLKK